ncbi:hypothetical protein KKC08_05485 [Patescibacteria group bacterium]|nr:hypothetical protein [Patescibacteria group bacterium]MBU4210734.1 hypothetical protein [Patescibacteria group bacterium]MBU4265324.1 hypothetical protein [Patescibacteria group bacterium]MBU4390307.1 hypothetical protein [Patescibacteria group bacterium]MBU4397589.1 hypothetical protein [Patescibacteria group bacterium]
MTKVQLSLTNQEAAILNSYGSELGYNLSKTIRFLISKAAEKFLQKGTIPVYKMSQKTEKKGLQALKEYKTGKTIKIDDVDNFFSQL